MIRYRIRRRGSSEWTYVTLDGDDADVIEAIVGSALTTCGRHVQRWEEDHWEDFDGLA